MGALVQVIAVGYPILGLVYLTDRLGAFVEPVFFVAFSAMVLTEISSRAPRWRHQPGLSGLRHARRTTLNRRHPPASRA